MIDKNIQQYNSQHEESSLTIAGFFDRVATPEDISVSVTETDFLAARDELIPSVSDQELLHYERVRLAFEGAGDRNQQQVHNGVRDSKTHSGHNGRRRLIIADQNGILTKRNGQPKISSLTGTMAKTDSTALSISDDETDSDTSYAEAEGGPLSDSSDGDSTSAEEAVIEDKSSVGNHLRGRFEHAQKNREKR